MAFITVKPAIAADTPRTTAAQVAPIETITNTDKAISIFNAGYSATSYCISTVGAVF
jgi:hypothetical protein